MEAGACCKDCYLYHLFMEEQAKLKSVHVFRQTCAMANHGLNCARMTQAKLRFGRWGSTPSTATARLRLTATELVPVWQIMPCATQPAMSQETLVLQTHGRSGKLVVIGTAVSSGRSTFH